MSEIREQPYPVRGILEQFKSGLVNLDTAEDVILIYIETSCKKGYSEGVVDTLKQRSDRLIDSQSDYKPHGDISVRVHEFKPLKSAFIDKEV